MTYRADPSVLWREVDGETIVLDPRTGAYYGLEGVGPSVWRLLQSPSSLEDLVRGLVEEFDAPEEELRRDLGPFLRSLSDVGLCHAPAR